MTGPGPDSPRECVDARLTAPEEVEDATAESTLAEENQALREANEALAERVATLQRSNAEMERFAYAASHDLQAPLRNATGFLELLARRYGPALDDRAMNWLHRALQCTEQMRALTSDLLAYSRLGGAEPDRVTTVDLDAVARQAQTVMADEIIGSSARVSVGKLPAIRGDQAQLLALFQNLLSNALKYRGEDVPRVEVSATTTDDTVTLHFADNGIGLAAEYHQQVFEPFKRLHTREEYPGSGIGLSICRRVVAHHGGDITIDSVPGTGATFNVTLPLRLEQLHVAD